MFEDVIKNIFAVDEQHGVKFNRKLIESLPGIFYVYKPVDNGYKLIGWNEKHVRDLGYTASTFRNMYANDFVTPEIYKQVDFAIKNVFKKGNWSVEADLNTTKGRIIPYKLYGYKFEHDKDQYLIGIGYDITIERKLRNILTKTKAEKNKVLEDVQRKERELVSTELQLAENNDVINFVNKKIKMILDKNTSLNVHTELKQLINTLETKYSNKKNWRLFTAHFAQVHHNFFENLIKKHPSLTETELRFCSYLKINLTTQQISSLLNISKDGVKKARYRLRIKFGLQRNDSLDRYIDQF